MMTITQEMLDAQSKRLHAGLADVSEGIDGLKAERARLRESLAQLSNEVLGSLPLMEVLARREFGNTNYNLLIQRAEEARALLSETKD
jgi:hypothetical protein